MAFQQIKTGDANLDRVQGNVAKAFADLGNDQLGIQNVTSSPAVKSYAVQAADRYIIADARAAALRIALPAPGVQQPLRVLNARGGKVTVARGDGQALGAGAASVDVTTSADFLCDGTQWWQI
jgi:hypothetical protein